MGAVIGPSGAQYKSLRGLTKTVPMQKLEVASGRETEGASDVYLLPSIDPSFKASQSYWVMDMGRVDASDLILIDSKVDTKKVAQFANCIWYDPKYGGPALLDTRASSDGKNYLFGKDPSAFEMAYYRNSLGDSFEAPKAEQFKKIDFSKLNLDQSLKLSSDEFLKKHSKLITNILSTTKSAGTSAPTKPAPVKSPTTKTPIKPPVPAGKPPITGTTRPAVTASSSKQGPATNQRTNSPSPAKASPLSAVKPNTAGVAQKPQASKNIQFADPVTGKLIATDTIQNGFFGSPTNSNLSWTQGQYEFEATNKQIIFSAKYTGNTDPSQPNSADISRLVLGGDFSFNSNGIVSGEAKTVTIFDAQINPDKNGFIETGVSYRFKPKTKIPAKLWELVNINNFESGVYQYSNVKEGGLGQAEGLIPANARYTDRAAIANKPDANFFQAGWWQSPFAENLI